MEQEILEKLKSWCDRQERCQQEVLNKLYTYRVSRSNADYFIAELISLNYINETRFAEAFVSGKFRIKKWGRLKIIQHLKVKKISEYSIKEGLKVIDDTEYLETLNILFERKHLDLKSEENLFVLKSKLSKYLMNKGYEGDLIWPLLNEKIRTFS